MRASSASGAGGSCGCLSRQMQRLPSSGTGNPSFLHRIFVMRLLCAVDAVEWGGGKHGCKTKDAAFEWD